MTLILFSQSPTKHSRIGNSLVWMSRISYWLHQANLGFFFPWGYENYQSYFSNRSNWVAPNDKAYFLYASIFGEPLSAGALASRSRLIEDQYEKKNSLEAFSWDLLQISNYNGNFLYITGKLGIYSDEVMAEIRKHKLVICHEPFNLTFNEESNLFCEDYSSIAPSQKLLTLNQKYIKDQSISKTTVALHIRRGDYQDWRKGKYFYDDNFWIAKVAELIAEDCQPWIFSNDLSEGLSNSLSLVGLLYQKAPLKTILYV